MLEPPPQQVLLFGRQAGQQFVAARSPEAVELLNAGLAEVDLFVLLRPGPLQKPGGGPPRFGPGLMDLRDTVDGTHGPGALHVGGEGGVSLGRMGNGAGRAADIPRRVSLAAAAGQNGAYFALFQFIQKAGWSTLSHDLSSCGQAAKTLEGNGMWTYVYILLFTECQSYFCTILCFCLITEVADQ